MDVTMLTTMTTTGAPADLLRVGRGGETPRPGKASASVVVHGTGGPGRAAVPAVAGGAVMARNKGLKEDMNSGEAARREA